MSRIGEVTKRLNLRRKQRKTRAEEGRKIKLRSLDKRVVLKRNYHARGFSLGALIFRTMAFLIDFSVTYVALSFLRSFEVHYNKWLGNVAIVLKLIRTYYPEIDKIDLLYIDYILLFFCLKILTTFILSVSFGQFVMGQRSENGFIYSRFGGILRVLLSLVTLPTLLLELPIIFGRRSFKEIITLTSVYQKSRFPLFGFILFVPIIYLSFASPLLENLYYAKGVAKADFYKVEDKFDKKNSHEYRHLTSNKFSFKTFTNLANNRFLLIPTYSMEKNKGTLRIRPYLEIYDQKNKTFGRFKYMKKFSLLSTLEEGQIENPLYRKVYPYLTLALKDKKRSPQKYREKSTQRDEDNLNLLFSDNTNRDVRDFVEEAFSLNLINYGQHAIKRGPFIRGHVLVRNAILKMTGNSDPESIGIVQMGKLSNFLSLVQKQTDLKGQNLKHVEDWFSLGSENARYYQLSWDDGPSGEKSAREFKKTFFFTIKWFWDYKDVFQFPEDEKQMSAFSIIDFYNSSHLTKDQRSTLGNFTYHYYFDLAKNAMETNDKPLQRKIESNIGRLIDIARLRKSDLGNAYSLKHLKFMSSLKKALDNQDRAYFNL